MDTATEVKSSDEIQSIAADKEDSTQVVIIEKKKIPLSKSVDLPVGKLHLNLDGVHPKIPQKSQPQELDDESFTNNKVKTQSTGLGKLKLTSGKLAKKISGTAKEKKEELMPIIRKKLKKLPKTSQKSAASSAQSEQKHQTKDLLAKHITPDNSESSSVSCDDDTNIYDFLEYLGASGNGYNEIEDELEEIDFDVKLSDDEPQKKKTKPREQKLGDNQSKIKKEKFLSESDGGSLRVKEKHAKSSELSAPISVSFLDLPDPRGSDGNNSTSFTESTDTDKVGDQQDLTKQSQKDLPPQYPIVRDKIAEKQASDNGQDESHPKKEMLLDQVTEKILQRDRKDSPVKQQKDSPPLPPNIGDFEDEKLGRGGGFIDKSESKYHEGKNEGKEKSEIFTEQEEKTREGEKSKLPISISAPTNPTVPEENLSEVKATNTSLTTTTATTTTVSFRRLSSSRAKYLKSKSLTDVHDRIVRKPEDGNNTTGNSNTENSNILNSNSGNDNSGVLVEPVAHTATPNISSEKTPDNLPSDNSTLVAQRRRSQSKGEYPRSERIVKVEPSTTTGGTFGVPSGGTETVETSKENSGDDEVSKEGKKEKNIGVSDTEKEIEVGRKRKSGKRRIARRAYTTERKRYDGKSPLSRDKFEKGKDLKEEVEEQDDGSNEEIDDTHSPFSSKGSGNRSDFMKGSPQKSIRNSASVQLSKGSESDKQAIVSALSAQPILRIQFPDQQQSLVIWNSQKTLRNCLSRLCDLRSIKLEDCLISDAESGRLIGDIDKTLGELGLFSITVVLKTGSSLTRTRSFLKSKTQFTAIKSGWLKIDGKEVWCELQSHFKLKYWNSNEKFQKLGSINLQFTCLKADDDANLLSGKSTPISIVTVGGKKLGILEASFSELEEWIQMIEGLLFSQLNRATEKFLFMRDGWLHQRVSVWIGSWNVGNTIPGSLDSWLPVDKNYDLIAVGAQECTYTSKLRIEQNNSEDWFRRITESIGPEYVVVASCSLWEIRNIVLVKKIYEAAISDVRSSVVSTGIGNVAGNKGGVGIAFNFHDTSMCFVTSHFAAHQECTSQRNFNYREIVRRMRFGNNHIDFPNRFHHVFWYGDLNYRLDLPMETVMKTVYGGHEMKLLYDHADQLKNELREKRCFVGFSELNPEFWPTYRFLRQTYDADGNRVYNDEKSRVPSWCDRILWKSFPNVDLEAKEYKSVPSIDTSDHVPIYAHFQISTRIPPHLLTSLFGRHEENVVFGILTFQELRAIIDDVDYFDEKKKKQMVK